MYDKQQIYDPARSGELAHFGIRGNNVRSFMQERRLANAIIRFVNQEEKPLITFSSNGDINILATKLYASPFSFTFPQAGITEPFYSCETGDSYGENDRSSIDNGT